MTQNVSVEFLVTNGFTQHQYPDGLFWVKWYHAEYFLQVNEDLNHFTDFENGWIEDLTEDEFIGIILANKHTINQK